MKIVQINTFSYKATGSIMMGIHEMLQSIGYDSYVVWGRGRDSNNKYEIAIKDDIGTKLHGIYTRLTDKTGFGSWSATKRLIDQLSRIKPDIIHLHNIHGYYLNIEMLFNYIKENNIKIVWTLHDCWAFTGHCAFFDMIGCKKWKKGCNHCIQKKTYPASLICDASSWNWAKKKELFHGLDAVIVTPSEWLKEIVKESFLKEYPINVIYNGIDLKAYYPRFDTNRVNRKYGITNKPVVLGVASEWTERKGLKDIIELSKRMGDVQFVVVGLTEKQIASIPRTVIGIKRTENLDELCDLYTRATVFFNPTYEDNFPTTNIESLACGTPIITYDTGGSPESISHFENYREKGLGEIVYKKDSKSVNYNVVENLLRKMIILTKSNEKMVTNNCLNAAQYYERSARLLKYDDVYARLLKRRVNETVLQDYK